ncbi:hypothetical protein V6307_17335 [Serratia marcescens]|uniref:hypothetical protein n=1 Tax=Serratia marcescens TaxID=615 RepID=UPI00156EEA3E|nr:hypothetical protein [Serratia marcescens]NSL14465.1 hypothetical protein [Serratia marcescens]HAV6633555.1 hypothetical protein [Serratia marcescens]
MTKIVTILDFKMNQIICSDFLCFVPPDTASSTIKIFGFSEFLASLALLVVIFTVSDIRYKFRISVAPIPLYGITFFIISLTGIGSLISDVWVSQKWWVIKSDINFRIWFQSLLGFLFLSCFMLWVYYAFIAPPRFGRRNYERYINSLYSIILRGNKNELAVIADELGLSAERIVSLGGVNKTAVAYAANDIMLLIANRRFCKVISNESPITVYKFFEAMSSKNKYDVPLNQFSAMISEEVLMNKESVIYHEDNGYNSGLMGYNQEWSRTIYGNSCLIDCFNGQFRSPLEMDYKIYYLLDSEQWEAYGRLICIYLEDLGRKKTFLTKSYTLARVLQEFKQCTSKLYCLNDNIEDGLKSEITKKAMVSIQFINSIFTLVKANKFNTSRVTYRYVKGKWKNDISDDIADFMFNIVIQASRVRSLDFITWEIQNNIVWSGLLDGMDFLDGEENSDLYKKSCKKLIRLIYDEIKEIGTRPNYKNIRLAGMLLNIFGLKMNGQYINKGKQLRFLKLVTIDTVRKHYLYLVEELPSIAEHMLGGGISFDADSKSLIKTYTSFLRKKPVQDILRLE